jgi:hypothetical protein
MGSGNSRGCAFEFCERYHRNGDEFLDHILRVTGDETWFSFLNVETKQPSKYWTHTHSSKRPKKFKQMLSACLPVS